MWQAKMRSTASGLKTLGIGLLAAGGLAACDAPGVSARSGAAASVAKGQVAFEQECSSCHGTSARGDGPMAVFVPGGVPNLRELSLRNGGRFPEPHVVAVITRISDLHDDVVAMPDFGDLLASQPAVYTAPDGETIPTDATVLRLAAYLATIQE